jgi:hypothetical protein
MDFQFLAYWMVPDLQSVAQHSSLKPVVNQQLADRLICNSFRVIFSFSARFRALHRLHQLSMAECPQILFTVSFDCSRFIDNHK